MTKRFGFLGVSPRDTGDLDTVYCESGLDINEAVQKLLQSYEDWKYPEKTIHYGVGFELQHVPRHLNLMYFRGDEWNKTSKELIRLIKQGAVPFSYMTVGNKWYRADQSLVEQGAFADDSRKALEDVRVLRGAIVMEHDERRFKGKILTGVTEGMEPVHMAPYFRTPRNSEGVPIPNPGEEMEHLVSTFLQSVGAEPKVDHMAAVRDISKRFS